ncbi:hypothetical protein GRAN_2463 [Granulicella sibirica]|uniref:Uncharacterized protein n=1 Tax=Granulicella sibirica TaxID=2479048 RepID=A0A4Q0T2A4_9BACT|nr:hypothetical protein GRAN_2463 [Granulicella sibirica]
MVTRRTAILPVRHVELRPRGHRQSHEEREKKDATHTETYSLARLLRQEKIR